MLIDFKVHNYRSFKTEQDFSMQTGKRLRKYQDTNTVMSTDERLLKSALIFGANANGKTNLIKSLIMLKNLVVNPTSDELQVLDSDTFGYNKKNTSFEICFSMSDDKYEYTLEYNTSEVVLALMM
ncbi:AAA family ATPase [Lactiplantibacillus fabifermentans]|nr:ATP-binding protein [Lactiplantibacillus fabifermentans]